MVLCGPFVKNPDILNQTPHTFELELRKKSGDEKLRSDKEDLG